MDIKAIKLKDFLKKTGSIYKNIIISATRARQIIDDRFQELSVEEDIEDSDQLDALLEDIDHDVDKPISQSTTEFMDDKLEWRDPEEEIETPIDDLNEK
jgi:DNA-directed RNA polymerase subunit K/omega